MTHDNKPQHLHSELPWVKDYGNTKGHIKSVRQTDGQYRLPTPTICRYDVNEMFGNRISDEEQEANAAYITLAANMHYELVKNLEELLPYAKNYAYKMGANLIQDKVEQAQSLLSRIKEASCS